MDLVELAKELKRQLESMKRANRKLIKEVDLSDEELLEFIDIYPKWEADLSVTVGEYYKYNGELYQVIKEHKTQADWTPDNVPALFNKVMPEGVIPEWVQPTGGHDAYNTGDKVIFEGKVYESVIDGNTWSPVDYPSSWKEI